MLSRGHRHYSVREVQSNQLFVLSAGSSGRAVIWGVTMRVVALRTGCQRGRTNALGRPDQMGVQGTATGGGARPGARRNVKY